MQIYTNTCVLRFLVHPSFCDYTCLNVVIARQNSKREFCLCRKIMVTLRSSNMAIGKLQTYI